MTFVPSKTALGIPQSTLVTLLHFCSYVAVKGICHILFTHSSVKRYLGCLQNWVEVWAILIYIYFLFLPRESKELCSLCPLRRVKLLIFTSVRAGHMTYQGRGQTTVEGWVVRRWGRENGLIRTIKSLLELTGLWGLKMDVCFRRTLGWISREALFCLFS